MDCYHIRYDFGAKEAAFDKLSILLKLRNQLLEADKKFGFYLFDSAVLLYQKKTGSNMEKDKDATSLLEKSPWLSGAVTAVGSIPLIGWISGVIQAMDIVGGATYDMFKKIWIWIKKP